MAGFTRVSLSGDGCSFLGVSIFLPGCFLFTAVCVCVHRPVEAGSE